MTIKITQLGNLTSVYGNTVVPVVANVAGSWTTVKGNLDQLTTYIISGPQTDIATINSNVTLANTTTKAYIDGQITAANAGVTSANIGMKGYVDNQTYSNIQVSAFIPTYSGNVTDVRATGTITVLGNLYIANTYVPALSNSAGVSGQFVFDSNYVYVCVATDTWKRANISTW